jgi:S-DNA-T family DNA segregation ATPase FtsK/SpoIIIE
MDNVLIGNTFSTYDEVLEKGTHILIAGTQGSGKSTLINGLIHSLCYRDPSPDLYLIDPKRVDLRKFRNMRLVKKRVTEGCEAAALLTDIINTMENRYKEMENKDIDLYDGKDIFVIIDEIADLIDTNGKEIIPLLKRIAQLGRAAKIHLIVATQILLAEIIKTAISGNFDTKIALRTVTANQSRVILGINGAESLPRYGYGIIYNADGIKRYALPPIPKEELDKAIEFWNRC